LTSAPLLGRQAEATSVDARIDSAAWMKPDPAMDKFVDELVAKMTLEEKIGQLSLLTSDWDSTGPTMRQGYQEDIRKGRIGSIFNAFTAKYTRDLQRIAVEETRLKIPLLFGYDVIHGHRTIFPISLGEAASWDLRSEEHTSELQSRENLVC